jgi:hypothetical protein
MAVLPKESRDLLEAARLVRDKIRQVKANTQFSDAYKLEFEQKQMRYMNDAIGQAKLKAEARATLLRDRAKRMFLEEESRPTKALEMSIFRDQVAGASKDELIALSLAPGDISQTKVLALGAELRRRGMDVYADGLARSRPTTAEPWTLSEDWRAADALVEQFETLEVAAEVAERCAHAMGKGNPLGGSGPLLMTEEGPVSVAIFFAEPKPGGGSR